MTTKEKPDPKEHRDQFGMPEDASLSDAQHVAKDIVEKAFVGEQSAAKTDENQNIGALGKAEYQPSNRRVKGFCPNIIHSAEQYTTYITEHVLPVFDANTDATRIIDRAVMEEGFFEIGQQVGESGLTVEAIVPLGGRWEGHSWVMVGNNLPGRQLSRGTLEGVQDLAESAASHPYKELEHLPEGYTIDVVKKDGRMNLSEEDLETLAVIFRASFKEYITDLFSKENVRQWANDGSTYPLVVRNPQGEIVVVTNGDLGETTVDGKSFKFMEIGDSASNPEYRSKGLNRAIKAVLISEGKRMGFDSIHAETRAAWGAPNFGNAKNGMEYCGTLPMNCKIKGPEDVQETSDPNLDDFYRNYGSLNVWAMTPKNKYWNIY